MMTRWRDGVFEYKIEKDSLWMLVFEHNTTTHGFFANKTDAEFKLERGKFSLLSKLSDKSFVHRFNESYEFLHEYPDNYTHLSNHWLQSVDPFLQLWSTNNENELAPGFIDLGLQISPNFHGLMKDDYPEKSLIDGIASNNWYWGIGDYCKQYNPLTAGPPGFLVSSVYLWIKVSNSSISHQTHQQSIHIKYSLISILFVILKP